MKRDPLAVLWRLRDAAVTDASRALAAGLQQERAARQQVVAHGETMRSEQAAAATDDVLAFAAWWPHAQDDAARLHQGLLTEQGRVDRLQQALVVRRTEAEGVAEALKQRRLVAALARSRADQAVLDEAAGRGARRRAMNAGPVG